MQYNHVNIKERGFEPLLNANSNEAQRNQTCQQSHANINENAFEPRFNRGLRRGSTKPDMSGMSYKYKWKGVRTETQRELRWGLNETGHVSKVTQILMKGRLNPRSTGAQMREGGSTKQWKHVWSHGSMGAQMRFNETADVSQVKQI